MYVLLLFTVVDLIVSHSARSFIADLVEMDEHLFYSVHLVCGAARQWRGGRDHQLESGLMDSVYSIKRKRTSTALDVLYRASKQCR